jgi:hypothetical protein
LINYVLAIISWGYTNGNTFWMNCLAALYHTNTLQVIYCILLMKNIALWLYKEIAFWLYYVLLPDLRCPKIHPLALDYSYIIEKWTIDTQSTPYLMIQGDLLSYPCSPYSACHRVIDNVMKDPTGFYKLYEQL